VTFEYFCSSRIRSHYHVWPLSTDVPLLVMLVTANHHRSCVSCCWRRLDDIVKHVVAARYHSFIVSAGPNLPKKWEENLTDPLPSTVPERAARAGQTTRGIRPNSWTVLLAVTSTKQLLTTKGTHLLHFLCTDSTTGPSRLGQTANGGQFKRRRSVDRDIVIAGCPFQ
jgi:hypothetical protein